MKKLMMDMTYVVYDKLLLKEIENDTGNGRILYSGIEEINIA